MSHAPASPSPLVIALHGGGVDARLWELVVERLPEFELVTPNLSPIAAEAEADPERLLDRLATSLPADRPVVVTGCSLGSVLAIALATRLGARARGVLMLSTSPVLIDDAFRARLAGLRELLSVETTEPMAEAMVRMMVYGFGPFAGEAIPRMTAMFQDCARTEQRPLMDLVSRLASPGECLELVGCPVRVMFGAFDSFLAPGWVDGWRQRIGRANVALLPDACHQLPLEQPELVADAIRQLAA